MTKIGLEIHGYLNTEEKLFCSCKAIHGAKIAKPNTYICPVCCGMPGAKPMLPNKQAIDKIIQISLILGCKINPKLIWKRKHYDWPDLPKGYQNTISGAYSVPVGENGKFLGIRIKQAHLEEDPAAWNPKTGEIDYNRSGSPLIEIVTEPDFSSSEEVINWLKQLIITLDYIKAIDKQAGIKADVNISTTGKRVEIKNINSLKNIQKAIEYETSRQEKQMQKHEETRMFDKEKLITKKMRSKEQAEDYRFISEPDLPIIKIEKNQVEKIKKTIPETPREKIKKLTQTHKIPKKHAETLTKKLDLVEFFENIIKRTNPKLAIRWTTEELLRVLNYAKKELDEVNIHPIHFSELLELIEKNIITESKAKEILNQFIPKSFSPKKHIKEHKKIFNQKQIKDLVEKTIKENPNAVKDYKEGKQKALNFLIGQIMKKSGKRADYKTIKKILSEKLK